MVRRYEALPSSKFGYVHDIHARSLASTVELTAPSCRGRMSFIMFTQILQKVYGVSKPFHIECQSFFNSIRVVIQIEQMELNTWVRLTK